MKKKKNLVGENKRTVLQPVLFNDKGKVSKGILTPNSDVLDELSSYKNMRKTRTKRAITRALLWTLIILLFPVIIFFSILVFSPNNGHSFFGYTFYLVTSGSMRPEFSEGDVIMVKTDFNIEDVQPGVDITFIRESDGKIVTHRVKSFQDTDGGREYTTYGINVPQGDDPGSVNYNNILGIRVKSLYTLGDIITFFRSTGGMIVLFILFAVMFGGVFVSFRLLNDIRAVGK